MPSPSRQKPRKRASREMGDSNDFILCRWCRKAYKAITPTHLFWKHHRSYQAYAERFPNAPLFAPETLRVIADEIIANWERQGRHWTKERVKETIQALQADRNPLHALAVKTRQPKLYGASVRIFGSWNGALHEADIDPLTVRRRTAWTTKSIALALQEAKKSGRLRHGAHFRRKHSGLVQATSQRWGSWRAGLIAAGLTPLRPPPVLWTLKEVRRQIQERVRRGESLLASEVHTHAPALRSAAQKLFGKHWSDIIRDLGYSYPGRHRWTREKLILGIRYLKRSGIPLQVVSVRRANLALAQAAVRWFKTWPRALQAAGIDPQANMTQHWNREDLRLLFKRLRRQGKLSRRDLRSVRRPGYVQAASSIQKYFGTLAAAFRELS